jgi:hypothetical protein
LCFIYYIFQSLNQLPHARQFALYRQINDKKSRALLGFLIVAVVIGERAYSSAAASWTASSVSITIAIGAASPGRGPVFRMRR